MKRKIPLIIAITALIFSIPLILIGLILLLLGIMYIIFGSGIGALDIILIPIFIIIAFTPAIISTLSIIFLRKTDKNIDIKIKDKIFFTLNIITIIFSILFILSQTIH